MAWIFWVVALLLLGVLWGWLRPRPEWIVRIRQGEVSVKRGKPSTRFIQEVSSLALPDGTINGIHHQGRLTLAFSRSLPKSCHQRIRNLWHLHR